MDELVTENCLNFYIHGIVNKRVAEQFGALSSGTDKDKDNFAYFSIKTYLLVLIRIASPPLRQF